MLTLGPYTLSMEMSPLTVPLNQGRPPRGVGLANYSGILCTVAVENVTSWLGPGAFLFLPTPVTCRSIVVTPVQVISAENTNDSILTVDVYQQGDPIPATGGYTLSALSGVSSSGEILTANAFAPNPVVIYTLSAAGYSSFDPTNLTLSFTPKNSSVILTADGMIAGTAVEYPNAWGWLDHSTGAVIAPFDLVGITADQTVHNLWLVSGLVAGTAVQYNLAGWVNTASPNNLVLKAGNGVGNGASPVTLTAVQV